MEAFRLSSGVFASFYLLGKFSDLEQIAIEDIVQKRTLPDCRLSCETCGFAFCKLNDFLNVIACLRTALDLLHDSVVFARVDMLQVAFILDENGLNPLDEAIDDNLVDE